MQLYLVRHGETIHNLEKRIQGPFLDDPLNARGLEQAAALERRFADAHAREGLRLEAVYSSPLKRAWMTAEHVARGAASPPPVRVAGLTEFSWGKYLGTQESGDTLAAMKRYHELWRAGQVDLAVEGRAGTFEGESPGGAFVRMWREVGPLLERHQREHPACAVALVGHGRLFKILLGKLVAGDIARMDEFRQGNTAVTLLEHAGSGPLDRDWRALVVNDTSHAAHLVREAPSDALV